MESIPVVLIDLTNLLFKPIGWQHYFYTLIGPYLILILTDETDEGVNRIGVCTKKKTPPGCARGHCFLCWIWKRIVTMETTRGCIFSVKRTETSLGAEWWKVSWCLMTRWHVSLERVAVEDFPQKNQSGQLEKTQTHVKKDLPWNVLQGSVWWQKQTNLYMGQENGPRTSHLVSVIWLLLCVCDNYAFIICKLFSTDVLSLLQNDKTSWTRLVRLKQTLRQLIVHSSSLCTPADDGHSIK